MKINTASKSPALPRAFFALLFCAIAAAVWAVTAALGNYPNTTVQLGANTTITPDVPPTNTTSINVSASTNFKGLLEGNPTTGVLRLTNAHPAGTFPATVTGFDGSGIPSTATFTLTVTTPAACNPVSFSAPAFLPVGEIPRTVAVGDFNRDGLQDLAVPNEGDAQVSVLLGTGGGNFGPATIVDTDDGPFDVTIGDFNGDGNQDLATANANSNTVSILLGDGAGAFNQPMNLVVPNLPSSVATGDFNGGDGRQDLVVGHFDAANVSILIGNGFGGFGPPTTFNVSGPPQSVVVGDFNGDGRQDLATANPTTDNVSVLLANPAGGGFATAVNFPAGANPVSIAVGLFNADSNQDLVAVNQDSGNVSLLLGNGNGGFATAANFNAGPLPSEAAVGDFNGDGQQDLAVALSGDGVAILLGNGAGGFAPGPVFAPGTPHFGLAVGDFNADGQQDLATASPTLVRLRSTAAPTGADNVSIFLRICPPAFSIDNVTQNEGGVGTATSFVFTVTKTGVTSLTTSVNFDTFDGSATAASGDYQTTTGTLNFEPAQPTRTITVIVNGDNIVEPDETFTVRLSNPVNATVSTGIGTGTIINDDQPTQTPTPTPTPTLTPTATPTTTPTPPVTPTPTPTVTPTPPPPTVTPTPTPTATTTPSPVPPTQPVNLSTRMRVQTGDRVAIGGLIITGNTPKRVLIRAIAPSLSQFGIIGVLADPVIELHGPGGFATVINNNWRDSQSAEIQATGLAPTDNLESAIVITLPPGAYTTIVRGNNNTSGVALVEIYDISQEVASKLANISTRAFVETGDNIVIAGFQLGNNGADTGLIVRGLGPSLASAGVPTVLANPRLELRNCDGSLILANNDWQDDPAQAAIIAGAGLAPSNNLEAAIAAALPPGPYTVLFFGQNNTTGIGLIEVYDRGVVAGAPAPLDRPPCAPSPAPATPTPTPTPIPTATPVSVCTENFDGVAAPALPAGWTATNAAGPAPFWLTTSVASDTAPNNAVIKDPEVVSDKRLDSRNIIVTSAATQLSFRNHFILQDTFDGGVLEVSSPNIAGGAFTDITNPAVGGSFVTGGYTDTLNGALGNPLAGRLAWSGNSGGYINTVVNLGPNVQGQTIKLRFRLGTDQATEVGAWRIDTLSIVGAACP